MKVKVVIEWIWSGVTDYSLYEKVQKTIIEALQREALDDFDKIMFSFSTQEGELDK